MKYLTPEGFQKIKQEVQELKTTKRQEIAKRLEEAKALGDLTENAEYADAKEAQAFNEGRILDLEAIIKESTIIDPEKLKQTNHNHQVQIGSSIEVKTESRGKKEKKEYTIVSSQESDPQQGKISNESPTGQAFIGHRKGDTIEVATPGGKIKYKIIKVK